MFRQNIIHILYKFIDYMLSLERTDGGGIQNQIALFSAPSLRALICIISIYIRAYIYIRNREPKLFEARKWSRVSRRVTVTSTSQRILACLYICVYICTCTPTRVSASYRLVLLLCTVPYLHMDIADVSRSSEARQRHASQRERLIRLCMGIVFA